MGPTVRQLLSGGVQHWYVRVPTSARVLMGISGYCVFFPGIVTMFDVDTRSELHSFEKQSTGPCPRSFVLCAGLYVICTFLHCCRNIVCCVDTHLSGHIRHGVAQDGRGPGVERVPKVSTRGDCVCCSYVPFRSLLSTCRVSQGLIRIRTEGICGLVSVPGTSLLLCAFLDGSPGVYDFNSRTLKHLGPPGHTETVFDVKFKPSDPNILATASFDSTIKVCSACVGHSNAVSRACG